MNRRLIVGVLLLIVAAIYFYFAPATSMTSTGTQVIYWVNIAPGIVLALFGAVLIATGARHKKEVT